MIEHGYISEDEMMDEKSKNFRDYNTGWDAGQKNNSYNRIGEDMYDDRLDQMFSDMVVEKRGW